MEHIGAQIKTLRKAQNLSVFRLSIKSEVTPYFIYRIEQGKTGKNVGVRTLQKLASALGCELHDLLCTGYRPSTQTGCELSE